MARHGKTQTGSLARPVDAPPPEKRKRGRPRTRPVPTAEEIEAKRKAREERARERAERAAEAKRRKSLTADMPDAWQKRIGRLIRSGPNNIEALEEGWATLHVLRGLYAAVYEDDKALAARTRADGEMLLAEAAKLPEGDSKRAAIEERGRLFCKARAHHEAAVQILADLIDKERRARDSMAAHMPKGFRKVTIVVDGGGSDGDPADNVHTHNTDVDDDFLRRARGTVEAAFGSEDEDAAASDLPDPPA